MIILFYKLELMALDGHAWDGSPDWFQANKLSLIVSKSNYMLFSNQKQHIILEEKSSFTN